MSLRWLALGDSYTIGEGVPPEGRWSHQLAARLRAGGIDIADPRTIAVTGWTTDELAAGIDAAEPLPRDWDFVSLLIGVNNQYRGRSVADYHAEFDGLLRRAIAFAGGNPARVLVLSIPDWGVTRFGRDSGRDPVQVAAELDAFNAAALEVCQARGVAFVDITTASRVDADAGPMLADDGLHPSATMYATWVDAAEPAARLLLEPGAAAHPLA
ncbi:MAG: SGNH/GDSL hydrolase family protein [Pseudoxanthomonas suwonensis]|nr:SGNH/GDSL hydrolase family protein [Pseudoxanthomonas suwonensis]